MADRLMTSLRWNALLRYDRAWSWPCIRVRPAANRSERRLDMEPAGGAYEPGLVPSADTSFQQA